MKSCVFNGDVGGLSQHRLSMCAYLKDHNEWGGGGVALRALGDLPLVALSYNDDVTEIQSSWCDTVASG